VYDSFDLSFEGGIHRNYQTPVAHAGRNILIHVTFCLCLAQDALEALRNTICRGGKFTPYLRQAGGSTVLHLAKTIQHAVYLASDLGKGDHIAGERQQVRITRRFLLVATQKRHDAVDGLQ